MSTSEKGGPAKKNGDKIPRGALAVVAVGLIATVAAALLADENLGGEAAGLEWVQTKSLPSSARVDVPGGGGKMQLTDGKLHATGVNVSGYMLFSSGALLRIDAGSPVGGGRITCRMKAPGQTEVAQTTGSRASYPRSSPELTLQEVPESGVQVEFSSHGTGLAEVALEDLPEQFATEKGIKVEWPTYRIGVEHWRWYLSPGPPSKTLALPFISIWRTTKVPSIAVSCTLTTSAGTASVHTAAALSKISEPIAE
ncbi:MAG: hypothetical protein ACHQCF_06640 [Solirubrobacterales bacterium]